MACNTDGGTPAFALIRGRFIYPGDASLEEMTETALLLDAELDAADPNEGKSAAWARYAHAPLN